MSRVVFGARTESQSKRTTIVMWDLSCESAQLALVNISRYGIRSETCLAQVNTYGLTVVCTMVDGRTAQLDCDLAERERERDR